MKVRLTSALLLLTPLAVGCLPGTGSWLCDPSECKHSPGVPAVECWDGSLGGSLCVRAGSGECVWEHRDCPPLPPPPCGTIAGLVCPEGRVCIDAPRDGCTWPTDPDCAGICVVPIFCGGIAAFPCPDPVRQECLDDPRDDCDPLRGGADCSGLCAPR